jgi:hypothetical protein
MGRSALALVVTLLAGSAWGQPNDAYKKGVKLENSGDLVGALASFESIAVAKRDWNTRLHIASVKRKLGRFSEAEQDLETIRTDPKADQPTIDTAASDLEDLRTRIPKLVIKLTTATTDVRVEVDGKSTTPPVTIAENPGAHSVVATRNDSVVFRRDVTLAESTTVEVLIDAPAPAATSVVAPPLHKDVPSPREETSSQRTWGWIGVGTGVVFAGAAVATWMYSGSLADSYLSDCAAGPCDPSRAKTVRTWETLSLVSAGIAVVTAGVGVTLLVTVPKEHSVAVSATTNGIWLRGSF